MLNSRTQSSLIMVCEPIEFAGFALSAGIGVYTVILKRRLTKEQLRTERSRQKVQRSKRKTEDVRRVHLWFNFVRGFIDWISGKDRKKNNPSDES